MERDRLDGWCEKAILGLVLAILAFAPLATGAVRPQDFIVVEWLTVIAIAVWVGRFWINPKHRLLWPPVCWAVLAFVAYAVGRYLTADIEYLARQELIKVLVYAALFFIVVNNLHRLETTQVVGMFLVFLAMAISVYAIYQFLASSEHVWHFLRPEIYRKRGSGTYICPNHLAGFLEMILPLSLAYTLTGRFNHLTKTFLGYAALMIFSGVVVSVSRGGWLSVGVSCSILFFWMLCQRGYRIQSLLLIAAFVGLTGLFLYKTELTSNRKEGFEAAARAEDFRFRLWTPALAMWRDHQWWGVGPNHFDYRFRQYRPHHNEVQRRPDRVHNDYLNTLVDWGTVGASLVALAWLLFFYGAVRSWKFVKRTPNDLASKRSNKSSFVLGGVLGLVAILVHSVLDFNMHIPANAIVAVTLMALVSGHFRFASEGYWVTVRPALRSLVTLVLAAAVVYLGNQSWRGTQEIVWLRKAGKATSAKARRTSLEKAFQVENKNSETAYQIGEDLRLQSWRGEGNYKAVAEEALSWFERSMKLNKWDPYSRLRYAMCLDWIGRMESAGNFFAQAYQLDPHGYYTVAHQGWHHVQLQDYLTARKWFERSLRLNWEDNPMARTYLSIIDRRLAEEPRAE